MDPQDATPFDCPDPPVRPEHMAALKLANKVLERPNADPDDDIAMLSRQLLRTREKLEVLWHFAACPLDHCEKCIKDAEIIKGLHELLGPPSDKCEAFFECPECGADIALGRGHAEDCPRAGADSMTKGQPAPAPIGADVERTVGSIPATGASLLDPKELRAAIVLMKNRDRSPLEQTIYDLLRIVEEDRERLQASEQAWKIIAKQNDKWNALPQSEKEAALQKALDSTTEDFVKAEDEIERLQQYMTKEQIDASRSKIGCAALTRPMRPEDPAP